MISEKQFEVIEDYFGKELKDRVDISIHNTEYINDDEEEARAFPECHNHVGVISFMAESDENRFFTKIYKLVGDFANLYEVCKVEIRTLEKEYGTFADIIFIELL